MRREIDRPHGVTLQVAAVPVGTHLRQNDTPGSGLVHDLAYWAFVGVRVATARTWKVGVVISRGRNVGTVLYERTLERGASPRAALDDLAQRCRSGEWDHASGQ